MRFTLSEFLLLPIAFLIAAATLGLAPLTIDSRTVARGYQSFLQMRQLKHLFNDESALSAGYATTNAINEYLQDTSIDTQNLVGREVPQLDPWGNPYICVKSPRGSGWDFYSAGEDGISASKGNDKDDLNTWNQSNGFYVQRDWHAKIIQVVILGMIGLPFAYIALVRVTRWIGSPSDVA